MKITNQTTHRPFMNFAKVISLFYFGIFFINIVWSQNYYIAPNGSDSNDGTLSQPWETIAKANASLQPGETVYIRQGTYHERIEPARSGTEGNKITYQNYQNEIAKIVGRSATENVVKITKSYIVINGLTLYHEDLPDCSGYGGCSDFRIMIVSILFSGAHHNEILNNKIVSPYPLVEKDTELFMREGGVTIASGAHHNLIQGNEIRNMSFMGIGLSKAPMFTKILNNIVVDYYQDGVHYGQGQDVNTNTLIEGNTFSGSVRSDGIQCDGEGIVNRGIIIRNNIIYNNAENNIDLKGTKNIIVEGNILYGSRGDNDGATRYHDHIDPPTYNDRQGGNSLTHGGSSFSEDIIVRNNIFYDNNGGITGRGGNGKGWMIYNNTLVNNARDYTGSNSTYTSARKPSFAGITAGSANNNQIILNNIIGDGPEAEISAPGSGIDLDYNLYFNTYKAVKLAHYRDNGPSNWDLLTFNQWKNTLNIDLNSIEQNPQFVNVPSRPIGNHSQFDFSLQSNSPAINKGRFLTTTTSSGSGTQIAVTDVRFFYDGFGIIPGDLIQFEGQTQRARITDVNYNTNVLTVDAALSWTSGLGIGLPYDGSAPDIGAFELESTLVTNEFENIDIAVYPNPIKDYKIQIRLPETIFVNTIKIYNILGKETFIKHVDSSENEFLLNPNLSKGIYIIKLNTSEKGLISKKIIIE